uniref:uncharacterized protein LOC123453785 n=1 Tax=Jaculus jaculus TaxID=51337 RepID=UPI001E1AFCE6|nr:uncharacterized protein LOC123453785 [Jaculus jaculus]
MLTCSLRSPSCGSVFLLPCRTALHYACAYGHREVVHLLLDYECTISVFDNEQCTPLIKASQREFHLCVDTLLTHGADPNDADMYGNTALHYAALNDDLELADLLLAYDANIEAKTKEGFTPYLLALQENKDFIAEFLEHMGADIHAEELLDRKHRKMHRRRMCKHTVRRREAARSTSPSFYRRATNRGARDSETERDEQDNDFNAQVERVRKKCLLKELTGSEKLHRRAAATVSAAADPAAPGSGSAAPASSAAAADGTDPPVPATPAPPASPAPTSTPATTIPDVDPFDSPAPSACDTLDGSDAPDAPHIPDDTPDGADTPDDPNTTDGPNITDGNDSPNGPDNSDRPANADGPDTPDGPYIPDGLDTSDGPVFPDGSKYPDVPDTANGPYTSDAPDSTNVSEYPDGLVTHHGPVTSNASDNPDLPVTPDGLDACDCPDTINDSDNTHGLVTPAGPDTPDDLHTPGGPDSPDSSDDPDGPNTCDVPVTHDGPDNHDDPDTLDGPDNTVVLDNPVGPDTPDVSDTSDGLDKPDGPDNPDGPDTRDGPDTPHSMDTCDDPDTSAVPDTSEALTTSVGFEISNGSSTSENPRVSDGPDAQDGPDSPAPPAALLDPAITVDADVPAPRSVPADGPASPKAADYDDEEHALKAVKDVPTKEKNDKNESACPLEKGNKHEITKSPLKELVRIPTPKTSTAEMDTPKGVSGHLVSDSTIRMERNNQAFSYKCLMNGAPCPLAEEKKSENSKFTTSESVSASTSAGSPFEMGTVPEPQVDGSHVSGDLHRTGRRNERAYPLEKGNKSALTKSQWRELVRIPTRETSASEMDSPYGPDTSGVPDTLDGPDTHDGLDTCDGPETTTPSDHPDGPDTPDCTDISDGPHNPDGPDIPDGADTPDGLDIPVGSDNPHDPDTPDGPDTPYSLGTSDDPDPSDVPDASEGPSTPVGPITSDGCSTSENPRVSHGPNTQDGPESPAPLAALLDPAISAEADVPAPLSVPADGPASPNAADYDDEEHALQVVKVVPTKEKNDKNESACPLEKVNKREITKRPFNELVRTSTPKTSTAKMDTLVEVNGRRVSGEVQHTGSRLNDGESTVRLERNDQAFSYKCLRNERAYPLEKENKSAITKSQLRELVRIPTRETSTSEMDSPYGPDSSGGPDPLEGLDTHDGLDTCDGPDTTTVSDNADSPDSPDGTDTSDGPHNPDGPDIPDGPDTPDGADIPVGSDNPHDPDTPDGPDTPYSLGTSDDPDPSDVPDTSEGPSTPVGPITSDGCSTSESPRVSHGPNAQDGPESPAPLAALLDRAISEEAEVPAPLSVPADGPPSPNAADYDDEEHALQVAKVVPAKEKNDKNESACPLEKVNKREITKSPLNELVRTSTPKTSTAEMDTLMEVNVHRLSESTVRLERNDQAFSYKCLRNERAYPLEKGNKSAITKRQLRELVRIPTRETSTSEMDSPYTPDSSGGPDPLDGLDTHDGLDTCDGPDTTTVSDNLDGPDSPDGTDTSDGPHNPDGPDIPDGPDTTDGADIPVGSDNPHDPDTPDGPDTPYSLGTSDDPDPSDVPDTSEGPSTPIGPITSDGCSTSESPRVSHGPNAQDGPESPAPLAALLDPAISAEADVPAPLSVPADGPASPNAADYDDEEHALQVAKVVHTKEKNDKNESACPLEKVNKREITKSPLKKLVRPSTPKTSTAEMDKLMEVNGHPLSESTIRLERNDHAFPYKYLRKKRAYPLGKGNKSAITKSQLRELVSIPTPETSTAGMDSMMEINSLSASDSTVGMENKYKVVPYKRLKEVNNSENDITVIGNEEMEKHKGFLHLNWKLGTAHKKHIKRSEPPCPLAEEKKSENSKFTTRESVSASTSERSPVETDTAQQAQVDGSHVPGDLHHTGRRKERAYPLGKGNKSAITKSQLRELVSIPTPETSTAGMDSMMEINSLSASDSTVGKENKYKVVPYKRLKEVNNSENDITVIGNEEMEKHKGFLHLNWKLGTAHKKHIKRSEPPCPLAEEKKSENSKFTTRESVSASTSERSPVETDTAQQAQVDGSHVPGDLHHTGRRAAENTSTELHKVGERVDRRSRRFHSFSINNFRRLIFFRSFEVL